MKFRVYGRGGKMIEGLPLLPAWEREARAKLATKGVNMIDFKGNIFRKQFYKAIGGVYFHQLLATEKLRSKVIGDRLGLNPTTAWRWMKETNTAGADKFFAVLLIVLRKDLQSIKLEPRGKLLFAAIRKQCESFARAYCTEPTCALDRDGFKALMRVMQLPAVNHLAPNQKADEEKKKSAMKEAVVQTNAMLRLDFDERALRALSIAGQAKQYSPGELDAIIAQWGMPYTMFAMGCTRKLGVEDV